QVHEVGLAFRETEATDEAIRVPALLGEADGLLVRAALGDELEMAQALADAMPLLGGTAFSLGETAVDVGDAARKAGKTGHAAFEAAAAISKRRITPAERPDVGDVVDHENRKRGREAEQHR